MSAGGAPVLHVEDVHVPGRLGPVNVRFAAGSFTAIVGENGAGKSTLLDALAGVLAPRAGVARLDGAPLLELSPRARAARVSSLGQQSAELDDVLTLERIAHGLVPQRGSAALLDDEATALVTAVARELGVEHLLDRMLGALSTGERRRVDVARALVAPNAAAFLLDEPHAGVDVRHRGLVSQALIRRARAGKIVVASVHDLGVAAAADRVLGLRDGRVVVDGPPVEAITPRTIEALYGVVGAVVVHEGGAIGVLLPR